jgi:hypothetical protein
VTQAELINLLRDCLTLWGADATPQAHEASVRLTTAGGYYDITAMPPDLRPARWSLQTPTREAAGRPARMHPSIGALLAALRNELSAEAPLERGNRLRIGTG